MKTVFGALQHFIGNGNKVHMIWTAALLIVLLVLSVLHHRWKDDRKKLRLWRMLALSPLLMCIAHFVIFVYPVTELLGRYLLLYVIGVLSLIPLLFAGRRIGYRIAAALCGILMALLGAYCLLDASHTYNHAKMSYTDSFRALVKDLDRTYVLKEWKGVDFAALEQKYLPDVQAAETEQNPAKFADAVKALTDELYDGHVGVRRAYDREQYPSAHQPRNYGMAMVQLDNGDVIAVNTDEAVSKLGIADGTVITKWDGRPVQEAISGHEPEYNIPVKANAERLAPVYLSANGGETIEVGYIDASGSEKTVTLSDFEAEQGAMQKTIDDLLQMKEFETMEEYEAFQALNFSVRMLDDTCGLLIVNAEGTDSNLHDILGYLTGEHKWAREMFREKLRSLKAQGMERLVIDLRNNTGGNDEVGFALVSLLTKEDMYGLGIGSRKNGQYICNAEHPIRGDGEFADLKAVALTNYECASAGDSLAQALGKLENVTLAGITDPCGCNQEVGGSCILSGGTVSVRYPTGLVLGEDGKPNIDTAADRISRDPVEVRIPLDYDAAMLLFRDKVDYELSWAQDYLKQQAQ